MSSLGKEQAICTRAKFRVKIKSLAEEARLIRREERRCKRVAWVAGSLRAHRIYVVRVEQRHTLLAYAFLRGTPYSVVERMPREQADVSKIERILKSLAGFSQGPEIQAWVGGRDGVIAA